MGQVRQIEPRLTGGERLVELLRLGLTGLEPVLSRLGRGVRVSVDLALPARMAAERATDRDRRARATIEAALVARLSELGLAPRLHVEARGHAAGAFCALHAAEAVLTHQAELALLGGIDSSYDPFVVEELLGQERILDGEHLDAMVPGEGVAFALVASRSDAAAMKLPALATVEGAAVDREPATLDNDVGLLGLGLSRAALALGKRLRDERRSLDWWISDMTPERFRVQEFQLAWPRAARGLMAPTSTLDHLPQHLGDLGAATLPTALALAAEGFRRGDPAARTCLMTGSTPGGDRGVVLAAASAPPGEGGAR
jgi:3-oxoacyl-[acyl-carrier-protein] synthase-1